MNLKFHINSPEALKMAREKNLAVLTAVAILNAEDWNIKPNEMGLFLTYFHENMAKSMYYTESIIEAIQDVRISMTRMDVIIERVVSTFKPRTHIEPLHPYYNYSLN